MGIISSNMGGTKLCASKSSYSIKERREIVEYYELNQKSESMNEVSSKFKVPIGTI